MSERSSKLWDEYIRWSLTPASERGSIATKAEWARAKNVTDRTLRRWEQDERFIARMDELSDKVAEERVASAARVVDEVEEDVSADEANYRVIKSKLIEGAAGGNQKDRELYFRTYGKQFVEEEAAARISDFASMDLEDLVAEALTVLGPSAMVAFLEKRGWKVEEVGS